MTRRLWTLAEANAAIFRVAEMIRHAQSDVAAMKDAQAQLQDLQTVHGDAMVMADHPDHDEYQDLIGRFHSARASLGATLQGFDALGVELKDVELGLVDFRAEMGGQEVLLCWIQGEQSITHWHTLDGGYAARQPIPDMDSPAS